MLNYLKLQALKAFFSAALEFVWKHSGRTIDAILSAAITGSVICMAWSNYSDSKSLLGFGLLVLFYAVLTILYVAAVRMRRATELLALTAAGLSAYRESLEAEAEAEPNIAINVDRIEVERG